MEGLLFAPHYLLWHYTRGFGAAYRFDRRLLNITRESFALALIFRTFASPWKRTAESYKKSDPGSWASTFIFNSLMRVLGMVIRSFILLGGVAAFMAAFIASVLVLAVWALLPFAVLGFFGLGVKSLLS